MPRFFLLPNLGSHASAPAARRHSPSFYVLEHVAVLTLRCLRLQASWAHKAPKVPLARGVLRAWGGEGQAAKSCGGCTKANGDNVKMAPACENDAVDAGAPAAKLAIVGWQSLDRGVRRVVLECTGMGRREKRDIGQVSH